jgi:FtsP/CotA-like multicopper oxidase with cupredoxin domain
MRRRDFLKAALVGGTSATLFSTLVANRGLGQALLKLDQATSQSTRKLRIVSCSIEVKRRATKVFGLVDAEGRPGLTFTEGQAFKVSLANELSEPTLIHWHGLRPPYEQRNGSTISDGGMSGTSA